VARNRHETSRCFLSERQSIVARKHRTPSAVPQFGFCLDQQPTCFEDGSDLLAPRCGNPNL
jgi:hypothetical protein